MSRTDTPHVPRVDEPSDADFDAVWALADTIPGWLKRGQARLLFDQARRLPKGARVLEIGSHQGRSTVVLAKAVAPLDGRVTCVDPFVEGRLFGGTATREKFERNLAEAGVEQVVDLVADYSTRLRPQWTDPFDLLYIDGKHDYWTVSDDLRWAEHVPAGGAVFVHDAFSSIGVTLALLRHVLPGRRLRYVGRVGSLARFVVATPSGRDRIRMLGQLPWWLRNVAIKVVLRAGRLLGLRGRPDPY